MTNFINRALAAEKKLFSVLAIVAMVAIGFSSCVEPGSKDFKITVSDITATTANVLIEPADTTVTYYYSYYPTESVATMTDDSLLLVIETELIMYEELISYMFGVELTRTEVLEFLLVNNVVELELKELDPETDYTFIAVKMDYTGITTGPIAKKIFTTQEFVKQDLTFQFTNTGSSVIVTPSNDIDPWDFYMMTLEYYVSAYNSDKNAAAKASYDYYGDEYAEPGEEEFLFSEIDATGDIVLIVYGCDGGITTDVYEYQFNIPAAANAPAMNMNFETLKTIKAKKNLATKMENLYKF